MEKDSSSVDSSARKSENVKAETKAVKWASGLGFLKDAKLVEQ